MAYIIVFDKKLFLLLFVKLVRLTSIFTMSSVHSSEAAKECPKCFLVCSWNPGQYNAMPTFIIIIGLQCNKADDPTIVKKADF